MVCASFLSDFWHEQLVEHDRQGVFLVLVGFLGAFGFIRLSTRLMRSPRVPWWPGSVVSEGGVHVHHLVFGIILMLAGGTLGFAFLAESPWLEVSSVLFGIGAGLTVDEFALWVFLDDVYWSREGRSSIDAAVITVAAMFLVMLGVRPFEVAGGSAADVIGAIVAAVIVVLTVGIAFAKQRLLHGIVGFFVWPVAAYGAIRIGKPRSPWARRFYGSRRPEKQSQAEARFRADRRTERLKERFRDAVGGSTTEVYEAKLAERERPDASAAVQERADRAAAAESEPRPGPG